MWPVTDNAIRQMWRDWATEKKNANDIMRKSGFKPGSSGELPPTPILSIEGAKRVCLDPTLVFPGESNFAVSGSIYGWGSNGFNQMGRPDGHADNFFEPTKTAQGISDPVWISNVELGTVIVTGDGAAYWSSTPYAAETPFNGFEEIAGLPEIVQSASGESGFPAQRHHYFLDVDGTVWGAGAYMAGPDPLGGSWYSLDSQTGFDGVYQMPTGLVSSVEQIRPVGRGLYFLKSDGSVGKWDYAETSPSYPTGCPSGIVKLTAGFCAYVLTDSGEIWSFGPNDIGQRGDGTYDYSTGFTQTLGGPYSDVAGTLQNGFGISGGKLYSWGQFGHMLGLGVEASGAANYAEPQQIGEDEDWTAVFAGARTAMATKDDGCLYAWGVNGAGQLGLGWAGGDEIPGIGFLGLAEPRKVQVAAAYPAWA